MNLVKIENGQTVVSSKKLTEDFGKEHAKVIRSIEGIISETEDAAKSGVMFYKAFIPDSYGRDQRAYLMNRDGFTLVTMGFTGNQQ